MDTEIVPENLETHSALTWLTAYQHNQTCHHASDDSTKTFLSNNAHLPNTDIVYKTERFP